MFAAVDAALELRSRVRTPEEVREIRVATYGVATKVAGNPDPKTPVEAKFSIASCVAAALVLGSVRLQAFTEERLSDPLLRDLVGRTRLEVDPEYDAAFPGQRAARVTIVHKDGTETHHIRNTRKGDPDDPLTDAELAEKFEDLTVPVVGERESAEWSRTLWGLADLADVRELAVGR